MGRRDVKQKDFLRLIFLAKITYLFGTMALFTKFKSGSPFFYDRMHRPSWIWCDNVEKKRIYRRYILFER